jgi:GT2 family glycosyltransferase
MAVSLVHNIEELVTVLITTKNRWSELVRALESLRSQDCRHKVIIMDDGSEDGTSEKLQKQFPEVRLYSFKNSEGLIVRRNQGVELAQTPYVLSIDDDCVLTSATIIGEIAAFCIRTSCAAVAWPFVDVRISNEIKSVSPTGDTWLCHSFRGCAFVVNRSNFLEAGGLRSSFFHQGEEEDFCIRLLDKGYPVLLGDGSPIHHFESPRRSWERMDFYGSRNLMLFAFFNVPLAYLPIQMTVSAIKCILYGFKIRRPYHKTRGVIHGFYDGIRLVRKERKAVSYKTYALYRKLKKNYLLQAV